MLERAEYCSFPPAFWQQFVYFTGNNDVLKAFTLKTTGKLSLTPTSKGTFLFVFPGAQPVVSSNGESNGIVWGRGSLFLLRSPRL
jgi:hypothetical protein